MNKKILLLFCIISLKSNAMSQLLEKSNNMLSRLEILYQKHPLAFFDLYYCVENPDEPLHPIFEKYFELLGFSDKEKKMKSEVCEEIKSNVDFSNGVEVKFISDAAVK